MVSLPECGRASTVYDHSPQRRWRHLDTMQFETLIVASTPRIECPENGVRIAAVPWAGKHSRFTLVLEHLAIEVIATWLSLSQGADLLGLDWDAAESIKRRGVERGLARRQMGEIRFLGLDEKSFSQSLGCVSLMGDLASSGVLEVVQGNDIDSGLR